MLSVEQLEDRTLLAVIDPVTNTSNFPNSAAVQIISVWDSNSDGILESSDEQGQCSGGMVSSFQVVTAGHCTFDSEQGGFADWVFVHPGRDGEFDRPFGEVEATKWYVPPDYANRESSSSDVSVIVLDRNVGNFTGWFGTEALNQPSDPGPAFGIRPTPTTYHFNILHYPGDHDFSGDEQFKGEVNYVLWPLSWVLLPVQDQFYSVPMSKMWTTHGSSGAPLFLDNDAIVGVLSNGDDVKVGDKGTDHYVKFNSSIGPYPWLLDTLRKDRPPVDRPVLVNRQDWFRTGAAGSVDKSKVNTGDVVHVSASVFNAGTAAAKNVQVRFRISSDSRYDNTDTLLGDAVIPSIAPFESKDAVLAVSLPSKPEGNWHIVWEIDPENSVTEFDVPLHEALNRRPIHHHGTSGSVTYFDDASEPDDNRNTATLLKPQVLLMPSWV